MRRVCRDCGYSIQMEICPIDGVAPDGTEVVIERMLALCLNVACMSIYTTRLSECQTQAEDFRYKGNLVTFVEDEIYDVADDWPNVANDNPEKEVYVARNDNRCKP